MSGKEPQHYIIRTKRREIDLTNLVVKEGDGSFNPNVALIVENHIESLSTASKYLMATIKDFVFSMFKSLSWVVNGITN